MAFTEACGKCGAPLTEGDRFCRFCRFCGDGRPHAPAPQQDEIANLLHASRKIEAIKLYHERHKVGLRAAKDAIDELEKQLGLVHR